MANGSKKNWDAVEREYIHGEWVTYEDILQNLRNSGVKEEQIPAMDTLKHYVLEHAEWDEKRQQAKTLEKHLIDTKIVENKANSYAERQTLLEKAKSLALHKLVDILQQEDVKANDINLCANAMTKISELDKENGARENDKDALAEIVAKLEVNING